MKSIKEKSNEYAKEYLLSPIAQRTPNIHFEAGANYVLDEIEKLVKTTTGEGGTYHYNLYIGLVNLFEQLKK
jgi:hypothetical protein